MFPTDYYCYQEQANEEDKAPLFTIKLTHWPHEGKCSKVSQPASVELSVELVSQKPASRDVIRKVIIKQMYEMAVLMHRLPFQGSG